MGKRPVSAPALSFAAMVVFALVAARPAAAQVEDPRIRQIVESVSEERLRALVEKLASFETRHTLSSADSPNRGVGAARQWIHDELRS